MRWFEVYKLYTDTHNYQIIILSKVKKHVLTYANTSCYDIFNKILDFIIYIFFVKFEYSIKKLTKMKNNISKFSFLTLTLISIFFNDQLLAQQVTDIPMGTVEIDGYIEEDWDVCPEREINIPCQTEIPTVTAWWKALYDADYLYVVVNVKDEGNHFPGWESGGNRFDYDIPVFFFDWNKHPKDGLGPSTPYSGHYMFAEGFEKGMYDKVISKESSEAESYPGGTYCYTLYGEDYVYEVAFPFNNFYDKNKVRITLNIAQAKRIFGFDVMIVDQDEGKTTSPSAIAWSSNNQDSRINMDNAGFVQLRICDCDFDFNVSETFVEIKDTAIIEVKTSTKNWRASSNQSWLKVSPAEGNSDSKITIIAEPFTGEASRVAAISFKASNYDSTLFGEKTVIVVQGEHTGSDDLSLKSIKLYPNPVRDYFRIEGITSKSELYVYDLYGKPVIKTEVGLNEEINTSSLSRGIYTLKLLSGSRAVNLKFIKE